MPKLGWTGTKPSKYAIEVTEEHGENTQQVALKIYRQLVVKSPVDTGLFKGNWQASVGRPILTTRTTKASGGLGTLDHGLVAEVEAKIKRKNPFVNIFISNNLPYAYPLEHGHSAQAPSGFLAQAVARYV